MWDRAASVAVRITARPPWKRDDGSGLGVAMKDLEDPSGAE
jgi:hypothetical protein